MTTIAPYIPLYLEGVLVTARLAFLSIIGGTLAALVLGIMRKSPRRSIRVLAYVIIELLRGATALIYLFWLYYALPLIPGAPRFGSEEVVILVLALTAGAYGAESVRAGLDSTPTTQSDAAFALGLSRASTFRRVLLPQAASRITPALGTLSVDVVKWTAIASFVGVHDILFIANTIRASVPNGTLVYILVAATYLILCSIVALGFRLLEAQLPLERARRASRMPRERSTSNAQRRKLTTS